jgi:microcystin-dependent protein
MAITTDDFNKIWASTSPLTPYEFNESNYKEGWNFIGGTPPSRQMWDFLQKQNDEKAQWLYLNVVQGIPVGVVQAFAGTDTPDGWLLCDGSAVSRTDYADLYSVIGDTYGAGDGSTTFNLPNLTDKFIEGSATAGTVKNAGLPNITGGVVVSGYGGNGAEQSNGAFKGNLTKNCFTIFEDSTSANKQRFYDTSFNASMSSAIYGNSTTVQPPALTMQYIIKY